MSSELKKVIDYYLSTGAYPCFLMYGDTVWKKGLFGYKLIELPDEKQYDQTALLEQPEYKCKRGTVVTQDSEGKVTTGIGFVAANLTVADDNIDLGLEVARVFKIDPAIMGMVFVSPEDEMMNWIGREDVFGI